MPIQIELAQNLLPLFVGGLMIVIGLWLFIASRYKRALLGEMLEVDTYTARDLRLLTMGDFSATVEVKGTIHCAQPITTPVTQSQCVWYHTEVRRKYETTHTERDSKGHTRTVTDTHWETVHEECNGVMFEVHDETGITFVDPQGAKTEPMTVYDEYRHDVPWFDVGWHMNTRGYQITERIIPVNVPIYVLGQADYDKGSDAVLVHYPSRGYTDPKRRTFLISLRSEEEMVRSHKRAVAGYWWSGVLLMLLGVVIIIGRSLVGNLIRITP